MAGFALNGRNAFRSVRLCVTLPSFVMWTFIKATLLRDVVHTRSASKKNECNSVRDSTIDCVAVAAAAAAISNDLRQSDYGDSSRRSSL